MEALSAILTMLMATGDPKPAIRNFAVETIPIACKYYCPYPRRCPCYQKPWNYVSPPVYNYFWDPLSNRLILGRQTNEVAEYLDVYPNFISTLLQVPVDRN